MHIFNFKINYVFDTNVMLFEIAYETFYIFFQKPTLNKENSLLQVYNVLTSITCIKHAFD